MSFAAAGTVPVNPRSRVVSYDVSSILGAAVAPLVAVAPLRAADGSPLLVGLYLSAMAVLTLIAVLAGRETKDVDIEA